MKSVNLSTDRKATGDFCDIATRKKEATGPTKPTTPAYYFIMSGSVAQ